MTLLIRAARLDAGVLLNEDMQDGRQVGGSTIVNPSFVPFAPANAALIDRLLPP